MALFELHPLVKQLAQSTSFLVTETLGGPLVIGTHNGTFHCDEALACGMLKLLPQYKDHNILRSRKPELLNTCSIVVDVGATYDFATFRFDHHQRGFDTKFSAERKTKLSSAGLVYKHFGRELIQLIANEEKVQVTENILDRLYLKVYDSFVEHIDGIDNGVPAADGESNYTVTTTLSARVGKLNPSWNEKDEVDVGDLFKKAMLLTSNEFVQCVRHQLLSWLPARNIVVAAVEGRGGVDSSLEIIKFDDYAPWSSHLFDLEKEQPELAGQIKYVLYPRQDGTWSVQCVPVEADSFTSRKPLPSPFRGVRDEELSTLWGIPGCVFVHAAGFIGGNKTYEGVLAMARSALTHVEDSGAREPKASKQS